MYNTVVKKEHVFIDEFEENVKQTDAAYLQLIKNKLIYILVGITIVIIFLMIPKTFWLIPTNKVKEKINPYGDPYLVYIEENLPAAQLKNPNDYFKLKQIKSLANGKLYYILPLADYSLTARVLAKNRFFFEQNEFDKIALVDFGFAWGDMAKDEYFNKIYAYSRQYLDSRSLLVGFKNEYQSQYRDKFSYLTKHSSHTHVIPSNKKIRSALNALKFGQTVKIEGYLVDVYDSSYKRFAITSLSLSDTDETSRGNGKNGGACEIMYVTKVQIGSKVFE